MELWREGVGGRSGGGGGGGFNLPDINFSSCFPSFHPSLGSSNHKSLLGAITVAVLQWEGGRIDSRVEDERREREERRGAVKRLPRLMLTENILIAKLNQPASR